MFKYFNCEQINIFMCLSMLDHETGYAKHEDGRTWTSKEKWLNCILEYATFVEEGWISLVWNEHKFQN